MTCKGLFQILSGNSSSDNLKKMYKHINHGACFFEIIIIIELVYYYMENKEYH